MSNISQHDWTYTMDRIFQKLDDTQYKEMVDFFDEQPEFTSPARLNAKFKKELPEKLNQVFGIDGSINLVNEAMNMIPRNDPGVQDLLRPFVAKLRPQGLRMRSRPEIPGISEDDWTDTMARIFKMLEDAQYKEMVDFFDEQGVIDAPAKFTAKFKRELPEKLIQKCGITESISVVNEAIKEIPRNDPGVQNLLRPFVAKLPQNSA
ncbi:uncharacterized protein LOC119781197 [Cyprinodon tularosa]|uniref:uncharacterized protein LOC119781197 n=1 Tax=Cyprinodon tularosa TaxID=77115 RepID=UPI0018E274EC|nr:uncharacterized protein LOC119781197 [Cyprinodon tularosa]